MRVYLPSTFDHLAQLHAEGSHPVVGGYGFTATPALIEAFEGLELEDVEYYAFLDAAEASLRLLHAGVENQPHRRVVVSVDIDDAACTIDEELGDSVVSVAVDRVPMKHIASIHIDPAANEEATAAAVAAIVESDLGEEDAANTVADAQDNFMAYREPSHLERFLTNP
ncbi:hypothetical protein C1Y63_09510 [Corynebacterium sp. 13CS0277]|uniref:DUF6912 family protein n=1 Tax=Corynebacterium sp. 13CS0277 TaxID=2071994 RepID=UPI000D042093|nr:hypothetical protein [Corynebacterium sp. 13CS0277]PRQ10777.1 hypothetical protein C1Y63_09510 [Corynebacterium sp. 13CS0277]